MMSIIEAHGWDAVFSEQLPGGKPFYTHHRVLLWQEDDGAVAGLVAPHGKGQRLRSAETFSTFSHYVESESQVPPTTIAAEPGWFVVERYSDAPTTGWWMPVLAWSVTADGWQIGAITLPGIEPNGPTAAEAGRVAFVHAPERPRHAVEDRWPLEDDVEASAA